jgi:hypothetical protein
MIRMIISKRIKLKIQVANILDTGNAYRVLIGKPEARKPINNLEVDGRILK